MQATALRKAGVLENAEKELLEFINVNLEKLPFRNLVVVMSLIINLKNKVNPYELIDGG